MYVLPPQGRPRICKYTKAERPDRPHHKNQNTRRAGRTHMCSGKCAAPAGWRTLVTDSATSRAAANSTAPVAAHEGSEPDMAVEAAPTVVAPMMPDTSRIATASSRAPRPVQFYVCIASATKHQNRHRCQGRRRTLTSNPKVRKGVMLPCYYAMCS